MLRAARLANETDQRNACLARLDTMFPLLEPSLLKQLVSKTDGDLWAACDELCGGDGEQASGKRARPATRSSQRRKLSAKDGFQSPEYLRAARTHLLNAFPWLWKSQVGIALPCAQYSSFAVRRRHGRRNDNVWDRYHVAWGTSQSRRAGIDRRTNEQWHDGGTRVRPCLTACPSLPAETSSRRACARLLE